MPIGSWPRMSPGFMNGTNPSTRWRSEPQMQVEVSLTMASRRLRILGSGTRSTDTLYGAHQISAFIMMISLWHGLAARALLTKTWAESPCHWHATSSREHGFPLGLGVFLALAGAGAVGLADDGEDLADLHDPLEVVQLFADDALGVLA